MFSIKIIGAAVIASSLVSNYVHAAEDNAVIVTATRTAQTADDSLASVTVITQEDIQRQQAHDLTDVLNNMIGIDMVNSGGYGKATNLYMRGTNTGHTLVLINGVQIGSATLGQVAYENIPVEMIERIEVVRGPRASLYGSEAIGGVIQIFTRQPSESTKVNFSAGGGSYQTRKYSTGVSGKLDNTSYSLQVSHFETEGINVKPDNNLDKDGYDSQSFNAVIKHQLNSTDYLEAFMMNTTGSNMYDYQYDVAGSTTDYSSEVEQQVTGARSVFNALNNWQVTLSANQNKDMSDQYKDKVKTSIYNTRRKTFLWQNDIVLNDSNLFTIGLENQDTSISGTSSHSKKSRENDAVFLENNWTGDENNLLVSFRRDDNEAFGAHNTGNIALGHQLDKLTRLVVSAGTAFKAPSFNDLYWPAGLYSAGNPDVLPEESESYEISLKQKNMEFNIFKTDIDNLIAWDDATGIWIPSNVASARIAGVEFKAGFLVGEWNTQLQLSLIDPRDSDTGEILNNRSRQSLRLDMDRNFNNLSLGATINAQGKRYSSTTVSGYTLLDLRAGYAFSKSWSLKGKLTNAMDREYTAHDGYLTAGRSAFFSINYQN